MARDAVPAADASQPGEDERDYRENDEEEEDDNYDVVRRKRLRKARPAPIKINAGKRRNVSFCPNKSVNNSNTSLSRSRRSLRL